MISNCEGCREEYDFMIKCLKETKNLSNARLYFAGKGLHEKGHLILTMVNEKGEIIVE